MHGIERGIQVGWSAAPAIEVSSIRPGVIHLPALIPSHLAFIQGMTARVHRAGSCQAPGGLDDLKDGMGSSPSRGAVLQQAFIRAADRGHWNECAFHCVR